MLFELYLQSGPQHKRTWVTVPAWPGITAFGPTTNEAIANTPAAIRRWFDFLRSHGERLPDPEPIELAVVEHKIERMLGFGQDVPSDSEPVSSHEAETALRWIEWTRDELIAAARAQKLPLGERPATGGRPARAILQHVADSEWSYVSANLGTLPGQSAASAGIEKAGDDPWQALAAERATVMARLRAMTPEELATVRERPGKSTRSARRMLRRFLEHEWEHVLELQARLA